MLVMLPHNERSMQLVESYGGVRQAAEAMRDGLCDALTQEERERAKLIRSREVTEIITECESNDIRIVTIEDEEYPALLKNIYNPPIVLFVQGSLKELDSSACLAVVGTRHPSKYALDSTHRICSELAAMGISLISGLAVGLDSVAHNAALAKGARTVGVLSCGNLIDYPSASHELKKRMIQSGGAVISELPPRTAVDPDYFQHRNRIISGLAHGTFIAEAPKISGTRFTAEHTIQQGRELFCLPPYDIFSNACNGVSTYLRDGATPVLGTEDIVYGLKNYIDFPED